LYTNLGKIDPHIKNMIFDIATICGELDEESNEKVFHHAMMLYKIKLRECEQAQGFKLLTFNHKGKEKTKYDWRQQIEKRLPPVGVLWLVIAGAVIFRLFAPLSISSWMFIIAGDASDIGQAWGNLYK
jgi:hypothetical protein